MKFINYCTDINILVLAILRVANYIVVTLLTKCKWLKNITIAVQILATQSMEWPRKALQVGKA